MRFNCIYWHEQHFKNRYTVQDYDNPGKTIVSHLYKDGNLFIHPDFSQNRTFTVREAARLQTFPDDVIFYSYKRVYPHHGTGNWVLF